MTGLWFLLSNSKSSKHTEQTQKWVVLFIPFTADLFSGHVLSRRLSNVLPVFSGTAPHCDASSLF